MASTKLANCDRRRNCSRPFVLLTTIVAAYFAGWMSNEWRRRSQPQPATPVMIQPAQPALIPVYPETSSDLIEQGMPIKQAPLKRFQFVRVLSKQRIQIERGMKADEWEMRQQLQRYLQEDGIIALPYGWSVEEYDELAGDMRPYSGPWKKVE